ncbi:MAG: ABC transporter ATP-binding protein [Chthoniobacterales bacterium]|nr:ABC transporter ATP-binding protein [Chthoniobacterales bacterium]
MIYVRDLVKRFGSKEAICGISFEVQKGEIVGFLGPNGAGKTTTMRILAGYLSPTAGQITVAGYDIFRQSLQARERIGYLPENVPLYPEMRVREYLSYRASLKGVRRKKIRERVNEVVEICGLTEVEKRVIGTISKGYRQRVGFADAIVHLPDLLILDEPTIGLDPNQIRQVRELILNLSKHHTILLSTHILSEVEMTCARVIILNQGKIAAVDTPERLRSRFRSTAAIILEIQIQNVKNLEKTLEKISFIDSFQVSEIPGNWLRVTIHVSNYDDIKEVCAILGKICLEEKWIIRHLSNQNVSLEELFNRITNLKV